MILLLNEEDKGGNLPNGSIDLGTFTPEPPVVPTANWIQISSIVNDWIDDGVVYECGINVQTISYNGYNLSKGNLMEGNNYEICKYMPN